MSTSVVPLASRCCSCHVTALRTDAGWPGRCWLKNADAFRRMARRGSRPESAPPTGRRRSGASDGEGGAAAALGKLVSLPALALQQPAKRAFDLTEFLRRQAQFSEVEPSAACADALTSA